MAGSKLNSMILDHGNVEALKVDGPAIQVLLPSEEALADLRIDTPGYLDNIATAKTAEDARILANVDTINRKITNKGLIPAFQQMSFLQG